MKALRRLQRVRKAQTTSKSIVKAARIAPEDLLRLFLSGKSSNTIATYRRDLVAFAKYLDSTVPEAIRVILNCSGPQANVLAIEWMGAMTTSNLSSNTQVRRISTLRCLTRLARRSGIIDWTLDVDSPKAQAYRDTRGPSLDAIHTLLATCGKDPEGRRNRVILLMLTGLGLRRFELVALRLYHFDRQEHRIKVKGKGGEDRWVTLPIDVEAPLLEWLRVSPVGSDPNAPIVCSLAKPGTGSPLSKQGLNYIVSKIGKRAGIKVWPHGLRHAGITLGLDEHDIREVQQFSRHKNVQTVITYDDNRKDLGAQVAESVARKLVQ